MKVSTPYEKAKLKADFYGYVVWPSVACGALFMLFLMLSESQPAVAAEQRVNRECECSGPDCDYALFHVQKNEYAHCRVDMKNPDDTCCVMELR